MGNCTYCKERINSLQGNNIFCIFWIFTSQDQASSTSAQHLREFSRKMIKALDPLGDPDVSHHFPGAGKLLLISFSNSRTTQSTKYTSQHVTMNAYNIIYMMTPVHTTHALVPCAKSTHCKATSFSGSQTSKLRGPPMPISPSTLFREIFPLRSSPPPPPNIFFLKKSPHFPSLFIFTSTEQLFSSFSFSVFFSSAKQMLIFLQIISSKLFRPKKI